MKLTCLSEGKGFHCPACHILNISGFCILLECPLDLSSLTIFNPIGAVEEEEERESQVSLSSNGLINSLPRLKTVASLGLWDISLIDAVLISSPMGLLGLPFLTRNGNFSGKVYATKVATKLGRLIMNDLVSLHEEALQIYGPDEEHENPEWMQWSELEKLPHVIKTVVMGKMAEELGSWSLPYSKSEIAQCIKKIEPIKYAEEICFNGSLILKPFSSGLELGACNWMIRSQGRTVTYLSSSIFKSATAAEFNYNDLEGNDFILFSDFSSLTDSVKGDGMNEERESEEREKVDFICSCVVDAVRNGGSVLVPIGRAGVMLQLLEEISLALEAYDLKVPIYVISPSAEEMLALANIIPEWVSRERQNKMYGGSSLFDHAELMKDKRLRVFPMIYAPDVIEEWREPCIVFSPHWTLRLGPAVHLLRQWHADDRCLLILESGFDADLALSPFAPVAMKVLRCSFLSGIPIKKVNPLLEFLKPKHILFPESLRSVVPLSENLSPILFYRENRTLSVPSTGGAAEASLSVELARRLCPRRAPQENMAIARLEARLQLSGGTHLLVPQTSPPDLGEKRLLWGPLNPNSLIASLSEMGIESSLEVEEEEEDGGRCRIIVERPSRGLIDVETGAAEISASDEDLAAAMRAAVCRNCEGI